MKKTISTIDLKRSCSLYSDSIQKTLQDLFSIEVATEVSSESVSKLEEKEDLYFSILFTGEIYGEFLIGLNKKTALRMLNIEFEPGQEEAAYWQNRNDILDTFKEVANIAAGTTLGQFKVAFPELSIAPPKSIEGHITLSAYQIERAKLHHADGNLSCYIYIDYMRLEINKTLEKNKQVLSEAQEKQEELKRLNKAKSEFLANMSHELRTPLNGMIGMLDILKTSNMNAVQQEQFEIIYRSGEFLLSLISDILEFSKIETGKLELEIKPFDLRRSIESVVENLATVVLQRGLDFNIQVAPQINGLYMGDETRVKQVLVNLIGNAVKFTPTGSISVIADVSSEGRVVIRVIDTGIGIPASKLETIFASFSQVDVSDNRKYGGTGLGLTISKSIVTAMNGDLRVASEEAKGSEFLIDVPLERAPGAATRIELPLLSLRRVRVLVENKSLLSTIESYVKSLNAATIVEQVDDINNADFAASDVVIAEFKNWQRLGEEVTTSVLNRVRDSGADVIFVTLPKDLEKLSLLQKSSGCKKIGFLNVPITLGRLANVLSEQTRPAAAVTNISQLSAGQNETAKTENRDPAGTAGLDMSTRKILVVEDNKVNQVVITTMLKQLGYEIEIANDGQQAVELIAQGWKFDLILMDCQMPVMNGYEATSAIRQLELTEKTRATIVALTANAFRETKETCFECGMDDFATKPIKFDTLKDVVKKAFDKVSN